MIVNTINTGQQGNLFGNLNRCRIEANNGSLAIYTPYLTDFVTDLKFYIPAHLRSWNPAKRAWLIDASQSAQILDLIKSHFGEDVALPEITNQAQEAVSGIYRIEYIGRCKQRGDENLAFGFANNNWSFVFSEKVLRLWFEKNEEEPQEKEKTPPKPKTFYQILRAKQDAPAADIKKAYYRMARQWHPDVCREEDARDRFEQIKKAYDVLANLQTRKRYDLGLKLQKQAVKQIKMPPRSTSGLRSGYGYSPDLRCGLINLTGYKSLGKIVVENILGWDDIENENGDFLVSSWNFDLQKIEQLWISRNTIF